MKVLSKNGAGAVNFKKLIQLCLFRVEEKIGEYQKVVGHLLSQSLSCTVAPFRA